MTSATDRIEKSAVLRAPLSRVWAAISDAQQFGAWFGVALDGPFETGTRLHGRIVGTLERRLQRFAGLPACDAGRKCHKDLAPIVQEQRLAQAALHDLAEQGVVFDNENAHGSNLT